MSIGILFLFIIDFLFIMLNTFLSLKRLHGIDIEMIDRPIPVQITQQENHSNAEHYHKKTLKPLHRLIIAKIPKQKLKQSVNMAVGAGGNCPPPPYFANQKN